MFKNALRNNNFYREKILSMKNNYNINKIKFPTRLIIEPTNSCNFLCKKCLYSEMKRPKIELDCNKYEDFLMKWKNKYGCFDKVEFAGGGEVLVTKNFVDIVNITSKIMPNTAQTTTSNLALLNENTAKLLVESGLRTWQVSLDTSNAIEFEKITGVNAYNLVINNIILLWNVMKENKNLKNHLQILAHRPYNDDYKIQMDKIKKVVWRYCHGISFAPYQSLNGRKTDNEFKLSEEKLYKNSLYPLTCRYLWSDLVVVSDGTVRICCSDMFDSPINFGNIFTDDPYAIVNNTSRVLFKNKMLNNKWDELYLCKSCHAPHS